MESVASQSGIHSESLPLKIELKWRDWFISVGSETQYIPVYAFPELQD